MGYFWGMKFFLTFKLCIIFFVGNGLCKNLSISMYIREREVFSDVADNGVPELFCILFCRRGCTQASRFIEFQKKIRAATHHFACVYDLRIGFFE